MHAKCIAMETTFKCIVHCVGSLMFTIRMPIFIIGSLTLINLFSQYKNNFISWLTILSASRHSSSGSGGGIHCISNSLIRFKRQILYKVSIRNCYAPIKVGANYLNVKQGLYWGCISELCKSFQGMCNTIGKYTLIFVR